MVEVLVLQLEHMWRFALYWLPLIARTGGRVPVDSPRGEVLDGIVQPMDSPTFCIPVESERTASFLRLPSHSRTGPGKLCGAVGRSYKEDFNRRGTPTTH